MLTVKGILLCNISRLLTMQKVAFWCVKGGLLKRKRLSFTLQYAAFYQAKRWFHVLKPYILHCVGADPCVRPGGFTY